jgi:hypothetical protein
MHAHMSDAVTIHETLTRDEWDLLSGLREIREDSLRDQLMRLMHDLVDYVSNPQCARAQGDGVPCRTVSLACEECLHVGDTIQSMRARLDGRVPAPPA